MSKKISRNELRRIKYHLYKEAGYTTKQAQKYRDKQLNIGGLRLENGQVPFKSQEFQKISARLRQQRLKRERQNEIKRIRYQALRKAGYTPKQANKYKSRKTIDVGDLRTNKKGKVDPNDKRFKDLVNRLRNRIGGVIYDKPGNFERIDHNIKSYKEFAYNVENDTVYTRWGMLTQDERYKERTMQIVKMLEREHGLTNDQAFYMLYYMVYHNKSYEDAINELLSSRDFEMYVSSKRGRS